ncbi:MAG: ribonuclease HI [Acidobacteria bacterium]|nr:ribonuclease HI [Acidobacteriota bacterium]
MKEVVAYTDGACSGNPGPGGFGVVLLWNGHRRELARGYRWTTNNRMELLAVIEALNALKGPSRVIVWSDSQYVVHAIEKGWAKRWRANGWRKGDKSPALNVDLWVELLALLEIHQVRFRWTRGHSGDAENERADELAVAALRGDDLAEDEGYPGGGSKPKNR